MNLTHEKRSGWRGRTEVSREGAHAIHRRAIRTGFTWTDRSVKQNTEEVMVYRIHNSRFTRDLAAYSSLVISPPTEWRLYLRHSDCTYGKLYSPRFRGKLESDGGKWNVDGSDCMINGRPTIIRRENGWHSISIRVERAWDPFYADTCEPAHQTVHCPAQKLPINANWAVVNQLVSLEVIFIECVESCTDASVSHVQSCSLSKLARCRFNACYEVSLLGMVLHELCAKDNIVFQTNKM